VDVIGDEVTIHSVEDHIPDPLSVHHRPVSVTFAHFEHGEVVIDPSLNEEAVSTGSITVAGA
jgi:exosome complex component RRP45